MLINFRVKNFLSFKELQTFSMVAGSTVRKAERVKKYNDLNLLKFAAVYGANGAGKSNLVKAITCMRTLVLVKPGNQFASIFYLFNDDLKNEPTYFDVDLKIDNHSYNYGFEYLSKDHKFISEWLVDLENHDKVLFERNEGKNISFANNFRDEEKILRAFEITCESNELFLSKIANATKAESLKLAYIAKKIYNWFNFKLRIVNPEQAMATDVYVEKSEKLHHLSDFIKKFAVGIEEVKPFDVPEVLAQNKIPPFVLLSIKDSFIKQANGNYDFKKVSLLGLHKDIWLLNMSFDKNTYEVKILYQTVCFKHKGSNEILTLENESDGTVRLLDLAEIIVSTEEDITYVVDELDRRLHPQVTCKFVDEFLTKAINNDSQLIVTTHESRLLDFNILRRDEIWFVDKKINESSLYSLEEFNVRFDKKIDKAYLDGRYGGVPIFDSVFPTYNECQE